MNKQYFIFSLALLSSTAVHAADAGDPHARKEPTMESYRKALGSAGWAPTGQDLQSLDSTKLSKLFDELGNSVDHFQAAAAHEQLALVPATHGAQATPKMVQAFQEYRETLLNHASDASTLSQAKQALAQKFLLKAPHIMNSLFEDPATAPVMRQLDAVDWLPFIAAMGANPLVLEFIADFKGDVGIVDAGSAERKALRKEKKELKEMQFQMLKQQNKLLTQHVALLQEQLATKKKSKPSKKQSQVLTSYLLASRGDDIASDSDGQRGSEFSFKPSSSSGSEAEQKQ